MRWVVGLAAGLALSVGTAHPSTYFHDDEQRMIDSVIKAVDGPFEGSCTERKDHYWESARGIIPLAVQWSKVAQFPKGYSSFQNDHTSEDNAEYLYGVWNRVSLKAGDQLMDAGCFPEALHIYRDIVDSTSRLVVQNRALERIEEVRSAMKSK